MSKLNMLEHMVSAYGSSETSDESSHKADVADEDNGIRQGVVYGDSMGTQHEGPSVYSKFRLPGKPGVQALPSANASGKTASQRPVSATNKKLQTRATGGLLRKK